MDFEETPDKAFFAGVLRHYRLTPSEFAQLPASDQEWMLGYEIHRQKRMKQWREALQGDDPQKSNFTPEVATLLMLEGL